MANFISLSYLPLSLGCFQMLNVLAKDKYSTFASGPGGETGDRLSSQLKQHKI
jgi:hypothetical protein